MFEWHVVAEAFGVPKICYEQRRAVQKFCHQSSDTSRDYKRRAGGSDLEGDQSAIVRNSSRYGGICARHAEIVGSYRRNGVCATHNRESESTKEKNEAKSSKNGTA